MTKLERWRLVTAPDFSFLLGEVAGDWRFPDGRPIVTTALQRLDVHRRRAWTQNTAYELGEELPDVGEDTAALPAPYVDLLRDIPPQHRLDVRYPVQGDRAFPLHERQMHAWSRSRGLRRLPLSWTWSPLPGDDRWTTDPAAWGFGVPGIALDAERVASAWTWRIWETWDNPDHGMPSFWIREHGSAPCRDHVSAMRAAETRAAELSRDRHVARSDDRGLKATIRDTNVAVNALLSRLAGSEELRRVAAELGVDPADARRLVLQAAFVANKQAITANSLPCLPPAEAAAGGKQDP